jgi:2-oxoglutarate dehydrogenase E1 component
MGPETSFKRVIDETDLTIAGNPDNVKTLVFCSGQIYYELLAEREKRGISNVALVRLEQIAPFPFDRVAKNCTRYANAEIVWAQQEPKNMGAFSYVLPRIMTATRELNNDEKRARYVGRAVSAAPATGMSKIHQMESTAILNAIFGEQEPEG